MIPGCFYRKAVFNFEQDQSLHKSDIKLTGDDSSTLTYVSTIATKCKNNLIKLIMITKTLYPKIVLGSAGQLDRQ